MKFLFKDNDDFEIVDDKDPKTLTLSLGKHTCKPHKHVGISLRHLVQTMPKLCSLSIEGECNPSSQTGNAKYETRDLDVGLLAFLLGLVADGNTNRIQNLRLFHVALVEMSAVTDDWEILRQTIVDWLYDLKKFTMECTKGPRSAYDRDQLNDTLTYLLSVSTLTTFRVLTPGVELNLPYLESCTNLEYVDLPYMELEGVDIEELCIALRHMPSLCSLGIRISPNLSNPKKSGRQLCDLTSTMRRPIKLWIYSEPIGRPLQDAFLMTLAKGIHSGNSQIKVLGFNDGLSNAALLAFARAVEIAGNLKSFYCLVNDSTSEIYHKIQYTLTLQRAQRALTQKGINKPKSQQEFAKAINLVNEDGDKSCSKMIKSSAIFNLLTQSTLLREELDEKTQVVANEKNCPKKDDCTDADSGGIPGVHPQDKSKDAAKDHNLQSGNENKKKTKLRVRCRQMLGRCGQVASSPFRRVWRGGRGSNYKRAYF
jgi:hypothetical protein